MTRTKDFLLLIVVLVVANSVLAASPDAPTLNLTVTGSHIQLSWSSSSSATGYTLYYAPYPDANQVYSLDMGSSLSVEGDLYASEAFYLAVQAYNNEGNSGYSNIEYFALSNPDAPAVISISPAADSEGATTDVDVIITFDKPMNDTVMTDPGAKIFTLKDIYIDYEMTGNVSASSDKFVFTFDPHQPLGEGKEYELIVSTRAVDNSGNLLAETFSGRFTVGALPSANFSSPFNIDDLKIVTFNPFGPIRKASDSGIGHGGIDIPLLDNAPLYAVADGVIISVEEGSGGRGGNDVMLLLRTDGVTDSGWYFEYEHITLQPGIGEGSQLSKNQFFASNPGTAANNHLELGFWDGTFTHSKKCWMNFLEFPNILNHFENSVRNDSGFIDNWTSIQEEGFYPFRAFLNPELYPGGAQLCYELGTDVRIPVN